MDQSIALIDEGILQSAACKKGSHVRKDQTVCEYYIVDVSIQEFNGANEQIKRFSWLCHNVRINGFTHVVIITK